MKDVRVTRRIVGACAALAAAAAAAEPPESAEFVLAERGRAPECAIVMPRDADECVRYASEELRRFLRETTGVELPVSEDAAQPALARAVVLETDMASGHVADAFRLHVEGGRRPRRPR